MSSSATASGQRSSRPRTQFTLGTLLVGMFVFAVFFGSSGMWYRRALQQRESSTTQIDQLRGLLETERRAHRETQARLLVAETQLKDAVGVRLGQQQIDRETALRGQQELGVLAQRLRQENARARQEIEGLRRQLQALGQSDPAQPAGVPSP